MLMDMYVFDVFACVYVCGCVYMCGVWVCTCVVCGCVHVWCVGVYMCGVWVCTCVMCGVWVCIRVVCGYVHICMLHCQVKQLDWVELVWPRNLKDQQTDPTNDVTKMMYPKVQK